MPPVAEESLPPVPSVVPDPPVELGYLGPESEEHAEVKREAKRTPDTNTEREEVIMFSLFKYLGMPTA